MLCLLKYHHADHRFQNLCMWYVLCVCQGKYRQYCQRLLYSLCPLDLQCGAFCSQIRVEIREVSFLNGNSLKFIGTCIILLVE